MRAGLVALLMIFGVASCGGDDDDGPREAADRTTTTAEVISSSTTTTELAGDAGRPQFPPSVTAPVPTRGEPMADGTHAVYLEAVDVEARTVTVDVIQFLTGDEADEAYREETGDDDEVPNDYFIRNASQDQRAMTVAGSVNVTVAWDGEGPRERSVTFDELPAYLADRGVGGNDRAVFWVVVEYETVTELYEQYLP